MNVTMEKIDNVTGIITVSIAESDYQPKVKKELRYIGEKRPERGFRPGHVPMSLLQKKYGTEVLIEVVNREAVDALSKYVDDNKLDILGEPLFANPEEQNFANPADFTVKFEVGLSPQIELSIDKSTTVPYYTITVDDQILAGRDAVLRKRMGKQVPGTEIDEDALARGSLVELDEAGAEKEGGITVESTVVSPKYFSDPSQTGLFMGKKIGDQVTFNPWATCKGNLTELASMLNVNKEEADTKADFRMTIKDILVVRDAEHDQEFYDGTFGKGVVTSEEEYFAKLKEMIAADFKAQSDYRFSVDAEAALKAQAGEIELPTAFLKKWLMKKDKEGKYTADNIDEEFDKMLPGLVSQLIKETAVKKLGVSVSDDDLTREANIVARQQFAQYGMTNVPDDVIERYGKQLVEDKEQRPAILDRAVDDKLFKAINAAVTLELKTVSVAEFNKIVADSQA